MEYKILYCTIKGETPLDYHLSGVFKGCEWNSALDHYAGLVKQYGMENVIFAKVPTIECVNVEVYYDGQRGNS